MKTEIEVEGIVVEVWESNGQTHASMAVGDLLKAISIRDEVVSGFTSSGVGDHYRYDWPNAHEQEILLKAIDVYRNPEKPRQVHQKSP
jgi:hypothetical protein